jgi:hypothetical protein
MSDAYYSTKDVRITLDSFESRVPIPQTFALAQLSCFHTPRDERWIESLQASGPVGACATGLTGLASAFGVAGDALDLFSSSHAPVIAVVAIGGAVASAFAGASWSVRRRPLELRAIYRGHLVCLYRTTDRQVYNQLTRALRRALEARELFVDV